VLPVLRRLRMRATRKRYLFRLGVGALVLLAACGGGAPEAIEIMALDDPAFDPIEVTVQVGEPARFVVTNEGEVDHEFVVGPEHVQEAHEMAAGEGMEHGEADAEALAVLELAPGETREVTVTFDQAG
jgi:uncharacterized cupredoxin-like copper-binding protein